MIAFVIQLVVIAFVVYMLLKKRNPLDAVPGPKSYPLIGNVHQLDMDKVFLNMADFAKQYGGIFKLYIFNKPVVIVNDQRFIHDVLVKQSLEFAGRPHSYRLKLISQGHNEIVFTDGPARNGRRKAMHTFVKQYGAGIQMLEDVTQTATDDLITRFAKQHGCPIEPGEFLFHCVTDVIAILLTGDTLGPEMIGEIKNVMGGAAEAVGPGVGIFLDWFPFIRFFGNDSYQRIQLIVKYQNAFMNKWLDEKPRDGFISFMQSMSEQEKIDSFLESRRSQITTGFEFFVAGVYTTSATLTCLMNVLCHYPDVQDKLQREIADIIGGSRHPNLRDQTNMPYLRATILEIGRFASVVPFSIPHRSKRTCKLDKYTIPEDTEVWPNLWALHHDDKLWDEPFKFKPKRFLDADGQLVPADHPNCRNIMPFGAGNRVCVGEVFALSRMFLITARILQNFTILPESTVEKQPSCDPRNMQMGMVVTPLPFKVRMVPLST